MEARLGRLIAHRELRVAVPSMRGPDRPARIKRVTYDLARQTPGATKVSTSSHGDENFTGMGA